MRYAMIIEPGERNYSAYLPDLPGCVATGKTIDEAEFDFYNEFDAAYQWFEQTPDDKLSDRLLRAKQMMFAYVKEITKN